MKPSKIGFLKTCVIMAAGISTVTYQLSILGLSPNAQADQNSNTEEKISPPSGEMRLNEYLVQVSRILSLQLSGSMVPEIFSDSTSPKITVPKVSLLTRSQLKDQLLSILALQSLAVIEDQSLGLLRIMRTRDARDEENSFLDKKESETANNDQFVTTVIPLAHYPAETMVRKLRSVAPVYARLFANEPSNQLLITDYSKNITKYRRFISELDTHEYSEELGRMKKNLDSKSECKSKLNFAQNDHQNTLLTALFLIIGLLIGFIIRGYMIRRIEGGL